MSFRQLHPVSADDRTLRRADSDDPAGEQILYAVAQPIRLRPIQKAAPVLPRPLDGSLHGSPAAEKVRIPHPLRQTFWSGTQFLYIHANGLVMDGANYGSVAVT